MNLTIFVFKILYSSQNSQFFTKITKVVRNYLKLFKTVKNDSKHKTTTLIEAMYQIGKQKNQKWQIKEPKIPKYCLIYTHNTASIRLRDKIKNQTKTKSNQKGKYVKFWFIKLESKERKPMYPKQIQYDCVEDFVTFIIDKNNTNTLKGTLKTVK